VEQTPTFDHDDVRAIIDGVFQINARLGDIADHLAVIRLLLGEDNGEDE
jgi:hypothetical protein